MTYTEPEKSTEVTEYETTVDLAPEPILVVNNDQSYSDLCEIPGQCVVIPNDVPESILLDDKLSNVGLDKIIVLTVHNPSVKIFLHVLKYGTNIKETFLGSELFMNVPKMKLKPKQTHRIVSTHVESIVVDQTVTSEDLVNMLVFLAYRVNFVALNSYQQNNVLLASQSIIDQFNFFVSQCGHKWEYISLVIAFKEDQYTRPILYKANFKYIKGLQIFQSEFSSTPNNTVKEILRSATESPIEVIHFNITAKVEEIYNLWSFHKTLKLLTMKIIVEDELNVGKYFGSLTSLRKLYLSLDRPGSCGSSARAINVNNLNRDVLPESLEYLEIMSKCALVFKTTLNFETQIIDGYTLIKLYVKSKG